MGDGIALPVILLVVGISLFFIEAIIPSMGILTIAGIVSVVAAIVLAFTVSTLYGIIAIACTLIAAPLAVMFFFYIARSTGIVLSRKQNGYSSSSSKEHLIGKTGVAATYLRPAGVALIDGKRIDVTAEGDFIAEGSRIEVVRADGIKVVVREAAAG